jgi:pyruvate carboxylase subunit B
MRYFVQVGSQEVVVDIDGDQVQVDGCPVAAKMLTMPGSPVVRLQLEGLTHELAVAGRLEGQWQLIDRGTVRSLEAVDERTRHIRSLAGTGGTEVTGGVVKAPMPGLVVRVLVGVGDVVVAGQGLVVLEAMKMENELKAPAAGVVREVRAVQGAAVEKGNVLVELAPAP